MRPILLVGTLAALLGPAPSQAQTPVEIADIMVRLCVGGGSMTIQNVSGSGSFSDLSLQSLDANGSVKKEFRITRSSTEGLVSGMNNAVSQIAANEADKVRDCLAPVRARLLEILFPLSPNPNVSAIHAENSSRYLGSNRWQWTIYISGTSQQISSIQCVVYHLHPTFTPRDVRVCNAGTDPAHAFSLTASGWGTFVVGIDLEAKDGSVRQIAHQLSFVDANTVVSPPELVHADNTSSYLGDNRWQWTIYISGTSQQISSIQCVVYHLHPTFTPRDVRVCDAGTDPARAFPLTRIGWGTFDVIIDLESKDGFVRQISRALSFG